MNQTTRATKTVFVVMPFEHTPTRGRPELDLFFMVNLKSRIEGEPSLGCEYRVSRSADEFDITARIIQDLYEAEIVLCDLSGNDPNPNVMYELGVRLALSDKPVIAFREAHPDNRRAFDVQGFYAHPYSPLKYSELEDFIIAKLRKFEAGEEAFRSPVLQVVSRTPSAIGLIERRRVERLLNGLAASVVGLRRVFAGSIEALLDEADSSIPRLKPGSDLVAFFDANREQLAAAPWHTLDFSPRPVPPLNTFLSEIPLNDVLPALEEKFVNTFVLEYYTYFFGSRHGWDDGPDLGYVIAFAKETALLCEIIATCWAWMRTADEAELGRLLGKLRDALKRSFLLRLGSVTGPALDEL